MLQYLSTRQLMRNKNKPVVFNLSYMADTLPPPEFHINHIPSFLLTLLFAVGKFKYLHEAMQVLWLSTVLLHQVLQL